MSTNTKIKIKLGRIVDEKFQLAFEKLLHIPFPVLKDTWAVSKTLNGLNQEIEAYNKIREAKIRTYGEETPAGVSVKAENRDVFFKELQELASQDIEIYLDHVIKVSPDTNVPNAEKRLTAMDILVLDGLVSME